MSKFKQHANKDVKLYLSLYLIVEELLLELG